MLNANKLTFGSDPEVATYYEKDGKEYVEPPAYFRKYLKVDHIPDPKHPVFILDNDIIVMEDGCAFEYTLPAVTNAQDMFDVVTKANLLLSEWLEQLGYGIAIVPTLHYEIQKWIDEDDAFKRCLIFGCEPDRDAIDRNYTCGVINALKHPYRYFGAHLHTGSYDPEVVAYLHKYWRPFVSTMAVLVGNVGIANTPYPELEKLRGQVYGAPGRYRLPKWGVEYRTLSNSWTHNLNTLEAIIENTKKAFELVQYKEKNLSILDRYLQPTCDAISSCDAELAKDILINVEKEL